MKSTATHFICIYSVTCMNLGTRITRQDYCSSGVREIKHLEPFLKSVGTEAVAVFYIAAKHPEQLFKEQYISRLREVSPYQPERWYSWQAKNAWVKKLIRDKKPLSLN